MKNYYLTTLICLFIIFEAGTLSAQPGKIDTKSAFFSGTPDRIRIADSSPINPDANPSAYQINGTDISLEAWIFPIDIPAGTDSRYIISRPANTGFGIDPYQTFALMIYGDAPFSHQPRIGISISDGTHPSGTGFEVFVEDTAKVKVGQWTHVAGTYDGNLVKLYINGIMVHSLPLSINIGTGSTGLYVGGASGGYFKGLIDDVRLWNSTRTESDIHSYKDSTLVGNESGLAGYWPLDSTYDSGGNVVTVDITSNHNDLVVQPNAKLLPFPQGSTVEIGPSYITINSSFQQALTGELYFGKLISDGWPKPTFSVSQKPPGMGFADDSVLWIAADNQFGWFSIIATATNAFGSITDTVNIFSEAIRPAVNQVQIDVTHRGKLGAWGQYGKGVVYKNRNGVFSGDFSLVDRNNSKFAGGLYTTGNSFHPLEGFSDLPSKFSGFSAFKTSFDDAWEAPNKIGVKIIQTAFNSTGQDNDKYAIIEYKVINTSGASIDDIFAQFSIDYDIGDYLGDWGGYDSLLQMSYGFEVGGENDPNYYGFSLLNKPTSGAALVYGGLGDVNYFRSTTHLTEFIRSPLTPGDTRNQISTGPYTMQTGDTLTVAFAFYAGDNLNDISKSALFARQVYSEGGMPSLNTATITEITDVPNDNGKQVRVSWKYSPKPAANGVTQFSLWRMDPERTYIDAAPALNDTMYSIVSPTLFDSTKSKGMFASTFQILAHTENPGIYTMSPFLSGYSLDNLFPQAPANLNVIKNGPTENALRWNSVPDDDVQYYKIYRGTSSSFALNGSSFLSVALDTLFIDSNIPSEIKYYYSVTAVDFSGNESQSGGSVTTSIRSKGDLVPDVYSLEQNYPNPFNPNTTISFGLPEASNVTLSVYDALGREVETLVNEQLSAGFHGYVWNAGNLSSGIYIYRITATAISGEKKEPFTRVKKLLLMK